MPMIKRSLKLVQIIALVLGLALFVCLIRSVGFREIIFSIRLVGFGYFALIGLAFFRHLLRTYAWRHCIEEDHRTVSIFKLFNVRLAGDTVRLLSFTGPFLGETSKAVLIRRELSMVHGMSSIIIENLSFMLSGILVMVTGLLLFVANFTMGTNVKVMGAIVSAAMIGSILAVKFAIKRNIPILANTIAFFARLTKFQWLKNQKAIIAETELKVHQFYQRRGSVFFLVLLLELASQFVTVTETYLILYFIGADVTVVIAYITEAVAKVVNLLFFFVPGQIGVTEGSNAFLMKLLGLGAAAGIALSLIDKIKMLFWAGYGLLVWIIVFRRRSRRDSDESSGLANKLSPTETLNG